MARRRDGDGVVRAAGGAVWRRRPDGAVEVLVVHRPRYDDWTLPKGKLDRGESDEDAARREVEEETGLRCTLGPDLGEVRYRDQHGDEKVVRYWAMEAGDGRFEPNREVDEVRWLPPLEAGLLLSYDHDRPVLQRLLDVT